MSSATHAGSNQATPVQYRPVKRLRITSLYAFGVQIGGVGLSYAASLLAARLAGPNNYGLYAFIVATMVVAAYLAALGYDSAIQRFVPTYVERRAPHLVVGVILFIERRVKLVAGLAMAVGAVAVGAATIGKPIEEAVTLGMGLTLIPIWALLLVRCSIVRAFGYALVALASDRVLRDCGLLVVLALLAILHQGQLDASFLVLVTIFSSLLALVVATLFSRRLRPQCSAPVQDGEEAAIWRRAAYPFLALTLGEALINRCGILILGGMNMMAEAGCFSLIVNLAALVMLPRLAVNAMLTPMISTLYERGDTAELSHVVSRSSLWSFAAASALGIGIWIASPTLLQWYGPTLIAGRAALGVLIVGQIVAAGAGAQLQLLKMTGREVGAAKILAVSLAANVMLCFVLIPSMSVMGAALAALGGILVWNISMAPLIWTHLRLRPALLQGLVRSAS